MDYSNYMDDYTSVTQQVHMVEFERSLSVIEFTIQSLIYTREYKAKKSSFKKKRSDVDFGDSKMIYSLSIGDTLLKWWNADDDSDNTWDPLADLASSQRSKSQKGQQPIQPPMRSKRVTIPFEFRFVSQDVSGGLC